MTFTIVFSILGLALTVAVILVARKAIKKHNKKMRRMHGPNWCIGLYEGPDPLTLSPAQGVTNPILKAADVTNMTSRLVADPFMVKHNSEFVLFFEMMEKKSGKGDIGYATSPDLKTWTYGGTALSEPFHLSYPYVFLHEGEHYMIPEAGKSNEMTLYCASTFPHTWERTATILKGTDRTAPLQDPSVIHHNDHWYLFSYAPQTKNLHLFTASNLKGPWNEHPNSPLIKESRHYARPGGRVIHYNNAIYRYAQDSVPSYGSKVWGFRITELTPATYMEEQTSNNPIIQAGNEAWNNKGMHTIDPHQMEDGSWIAIVDGIGDGIGATAP